jgi:hypothetical protein
MSGDLEVCSTRGRPPLQEAVLRLRHEAYHHMGHLAPRADGRFDDTHDAHDGAESLLCLLAGRPVGTIRALRRAAGAPLDRLLCHAAFPDEAAQAVGDAAAIEFCRFAVHPGSLGPAFLRVKVALLKAALAIVSTEGFGIGVASVRDEHLRFYTGFLGMRPCSSPRLYPGLSCAMSLLVGDLQAVLARPQPGLQGLLPGDAQLARWRAERRLVA